MLKSRKSRKVKVVSRGLNDSRTHALYRAGLQFFSESDCDAVSIARIVKGAECSVGAFYERFPDKNAYLIFLIRNSFRAKINRLENSFSEIVRQKSSRRLIIGEIVKFLTGEFSGDKTAGVIRVAFKLAATHPEALTPITEYRAVANEIIFHILKPHIKGRDVRNRVEEGLQIVFAVIFDAIQQNYGPLQINDARMSAVLARQFDARISDNSKLPRGTVFNSTKSARNKNQNKELAIESEEIASALRNESCKSAPKTKSQRRRKVKLI